jgi:catechol 2,3-dioxygenase-like lactoylglutathione lyase family enzyme
MHTSLDHCVVHVSHWARSNAFYRDVVGAELGRHGVAIEEGPVARHGALGAGVSVLFRDPDGSLLEFIAY